MQELRQDIFPVCSFGRAENVFYQSSDSLSPRDLPLSSVLSLIVGHPEPIFPSHILDRDDWETAVIEIVATGAKPRVQVALGREWEELQAKIRFATHLGWGLDVLVDRTLTMLVTPPELAQIQDWRWIACPLRFFNLKDMAQSLNTHEAQKPVLWCFLEPRDAQTLLLNPDEVILAKRKMGELPLLVLKSSLNAASGFYQNPTLEMYQTHFVELGAHKKTRGLVAGKLKNFPQLFSLLLFFGSFFLAEGRRPIIDKISAIPFWKLYPAAGHAKKILMLISWPILKPYWFIKFQYEKRIYPVVKGLLYDD